MRKNWEESDVLGEGEGEELGKVEVDWEDSVEMELSVAKPCLAIIDVLDRVGSNTMKNLGIRYSSYYLSE